MKEEKDEAVVEEGPRSFAVFLQQFDGGTLHAEISEEMRDLTAYLYTQSANSGGKAKGKLSLSFDIVVESGGVVSIKPEIAVKKPKVERSRQIYWTTPGNNLTPHTPRQQRLPLREVTSTEAEVRDVSSDTRVVRSV